MEPEPRPRQLFNIHNLCIVKHASKVSYMQIQPKRFYDHTQPTPTPMTHLSHTYHTPIITHLLSHTYDTPSAHQ